MLTFSCLPGNVIVNNTGDTHVWVKNANHNVISANIGTNFSVSDTSSGSFTGHTGGSVTHQA